MIDSIYTGITGVRSNQTRMNVIGNNVANINTTAYKAGRATFSDVMSKTLGEGTAARQDVSATNPRQSGLGVQVASIDTVQRQGSLQATGIDTDLAIEGEGLFIVTDGTRDLYTRDGTFAFDVDGKLMDPATGLVVKGNLAQDATTPGQVQFSAELKELSIPLNQESKAQATKYVTLAGNLDASGGSPRIWTEDTVFGQPARHAGLTAGQLANFNTQLDGANPGDAKLKVTVSEGGAVSGGTLDLPIKQYGTIAVLRDQLNALVNADDSLRGKVIYSQELVGGATSLVLRSLAGGENVSVTVDNAATSGMLISSLLGFTKGASQTGQAASISASASTPLNDLANVGKDLTDGDILRFTGVKPNGEQFEGEFIYDKNVRNNLGHLFAAVEDAYGGVRAGLDANTGQLILTESTGSSSATQGTTRIVGFDVTFSLLDKATTDAELKSGLLGDQSDYEFSTNTQVFDDQGQAHSLTFTFNKGLVENEWNWTATIDGYQPVSGNVGKAAFLPDGTVDNFEATDGSVLSFAPSSGATPMEITANSTDPAGTFGGLTQFVASSSVAVRDQDGRASGRLVSVSIEDNGHVRGLFDNGDSQVFARVALAAFGNPGGLRREGGNLFAETVSSGTARVGEATTEIAGGIRSGSVEMSNVDLAEEFTNMIVTQRGFQASARSITTSDELLSELVNLKR
ncbi:MAG: flagellar hook-basal body complex protein [Gemmatimonadota bacterium]